jgi:DNA polymerase/3'-5' exonuclease PolX
LAEAGELKSIAGVGEALAIKVQEFLNTGDMA